MVASDQDLHCLVCGKDRGYSEHILARVDGSDQFMMIHHGCLLHTSRWYYDKASGSVYSKLPINIKSGTTGINEIVLDIFSSRLGPEVLIDSSTILSGLPINTMDWTSALIELETHFDIDLQSESIQSWVTLGDIVETLNNG